MEVTMHNIVEHNHTVLGVVEDYEVPVSVTMEIKELRTIVYGLLEYKDNLVKTAMESSGAEDLIFVGEQLTAIGGLLGSLEEHNRTHRGSRLERSLDMIGGHGK
jgi:hypothetical protein